jgi:hypothetical protein
MIPHRLASYRAKYKSATHTDLAGLLARITEPAPIFGSFRMIIVARVKRPHRSQFDQSVQRGVFWAIGTYSPRVTTTNVFKVKVKA